MSVEVMDVTETRLIRKEANAVLEKAKSVRVRTQQDYINAGEDLKDFMTAKKKVKDKFEPSLKSLRKGVRDLQAEVKDILRPYEMGEEILKDAMGKYASDMKKKREEQERVAREKEEKKAEEENKKRLVEARKARDREEVKRLKEKPVAVDPVKVKRSVPLHDGITARTIWSAEIEDLMELVKSVASGKISLDVLQPNMLILNQMAREYKGSMDVPGVKASSREAIGAQARRDGE